MNFCWNALAPQIRRRKRKHPVGTHETWPYFGLTLEEASHAVRASKRTLRRIIREDGYVAWLVPTDMVNVLVCAQFFIGGILDLLNIDSIAVKEKVLSTQRFNLLLMANIPIAPVLSNTADSSGVLTKGINRALQCKLGYINGCFLDGPAAIDIDQ
ncbi:hypothetical protein Tco_1167796 [Tanacetum coccineum]